jgi:hypothetical protein
MKSILVLTALLFLNSEALLASSETSSIVLDAIESRENQDQGLKAKVIIDDAKTFFTKGYLSMPLAHLVHEILKNQEDLSVTDAVKSIVKTIDEQGLSQQQTK